MLSNAVWCLCGAMFAFLWCLAGLWRELSLMRHAIRMILEVLSDELDS